MRYGVFVLIAVFITTTACAKHKMPEREYVSQHCPGRIEVVLQDRTRVDCLTDEYAIEFDFASKWAQAIGQSLHYARITGRMPAIYLILESSTEMRFVNRVGPLCNAHGIELVLIENY